MAQKKSKSKASKATRKRTPPADPTPADEQPHDKAQDPAFEEELNRRVLLTFTLHKHLMKILGCLEDYEYVGIDAEDNRSAEIAMAYHAVLEAETAQAADCIVQLPQTDFMRDLHEEVHIIRQSLDRAKTRAENMIEDGADDEDVIRCIRRAVQQSGEEVARSLNRMAAALKTKELTAEMRERTQAAEEYLATIQLAKASQDSQEGQARDGQQHETHVGSGVPEAADTQEDSHLYYPRPMSKKEIGSAFGLASDHRKIAAEVDALFRSWKQELRKVSHGKYLVPLDKMPSSFREKLRAYVKLHHGNDL